MQIARKIPLAASGLALGFAGLGSLLKSQSETVWLVCGALSLTLILLIVTRFLLSPKDTLAEAMSPVVHSTLPAFFMTITILTTYLAPAAPGAAVALWWAVLVAQIAVSVLFVVRQLPSFNLDSVLPSWFLISIGYVVSAVTSPVYSLEAVGQILVWFGVLGYVCTLPVVVARLVKVGSLPAPIAPLIAIVTAPPALLLTGYISTNPEPSGLMVGTLLTLWAVSFTFVATRVPSVLRLGFLPTLGALTFPVVISATALTKSAASVGGAGVLGSMLSVAAPAVTLIASAMVAYVGVRYALYLASLARS